MAFCENCGKEMSDQAVSCPNCGHPRGATGLETPQFGVGTPIIPTGQRATEWWKRLVAIIIDGFVLFIPLYVLGGLLGLAASGDGATSALGDRRALFALSPGMWGLLTIGGMLYYAILNGGERGQTVGKMAMRIQVRDIDTGGPIGVGRGFIRTLIPQLTSGFTCGILPLLDGLWPLWDPRRQALHDKMARSIVVDAP